MMNDQAVAEAFINWTQHAIVTDQQISVTINDPSADRKVIRQMIMHENELFGQRRFIFALLQGLLWASASSLIQKDDAKANADLVYIIAGAGAFLAFAAAFSFRLTNEAIFALLEDLRPAPTANIDVGAGANRVIGLNPWLQQTKTRRIKFFFLCNNPSLVPGAVAVTWVVFAICLRLKE